VKRSGSGAPLRIGTRGSPLARWQAEHVAAALREAHPGLAVELREIRTHGDRDRNSPLATIGGAGLFTKEIQVALLEDEVDVAVHSLKDLPTAGPEALVLAAVPAREDPTDALIAPRHGFFAALPPGARVGTGSLRRRAQLLHLRPDLEVVGLRGNVETRLRQALDGAVDAVILAGAGLRRLGLDGHVTERLEPPRFLPAVGQGALGLECRAADGRVRSLLAALDDAAAHACVCAERALLAELGGGCLLPLGAATSIVGETLRLDAAILDLEGRERLAISLTGPLAEPLALGQHAAAALRALGAERLIAALPAG
jgi:hydroxymethylbilane synthase